MFVALLGIALVLGIRVIHLWRSHRRVARIRRASGGRKRPRWRRHGCFDRSGQPYMGTVRR